MYISRYGLQQVTILQLAFLFRPSFFSFFLFLFTILLTGLSQEDIIVDVIRCSCVNPF